MSKLESAKVAVSVTADGQGSVQATVSGIGAEAEAIIKKAEDEGIPVVQDAERVGTLLRSQGKNSCIPAEIYELMSAVISFAQELNELRVSSPETTEESDPLPD